MAKTIGQKIKERRLELGLTQEELGKMIGVKDPAIYKYEAGIVENIKRSTQLKLAQALQMSPVELFYSDEDTTPTKEALLDSIAKEYGKDSRQALELYVQLDAEDRSEIRGAMKFAFRADKYKIKEGLKIG